jgi:hypothetical protein
MYSVVWCGLPFPFLLFVILDDKKLVTVQRSTDEDSLRRVDLVEGGRGKALETDTPL